MVVHNFLSDADYDSIIADTVKRYDTTLFWQDISIALSFVQLRRENVLVFHENCCEGRFACENAESDSRGANLFVPVHMGEKVYESLIYPETREKNRLGMSSWL